MQLFTLRVASNKEDQVREKLARKVKIEGLEEFEKPEGEVSVSGDFKKSDKVRVTNGAFMNFEGEVDEVIPDKGTVRIITTIFGRPTPLELEYWQIEKM